MKRVYGMMWVLASLSLVRGCGVSVRDAAADGIIGGVSDTIATVLSTFALQFFGLSA